MNRSGIQRNGIPLSTTMSSRMRDVQIPADLCAAAEAKFKGRFATLEELLIFVIGELVRDDSAKMDEADRRLIDERLRDLGYI